MYYELVNLECYAYTEHCVWWDSNALVREMQLHVLNVIRFSVLY